jgi:hypothetical protein
MTSHIYLALGEWEAVERANVAAMATVNQQRAARNRPPSRCGHTQEWLVYSLLQQGKDAGAELGGCGNEATAEVGGLLHNFEYGRAQAAFREAQAADPDNVMPFWGEAMTYNHPVWMEQDSKAGRAALSQLGTTEEARAAKARTPRERGMLAAVEALYGTGTKVERDYAYARRMESLFAADPSDVDVRAFTALSIMGSLMTAATRRSICARRRCSRRFFRFSSRILAFSII